MNRIFGVFAFSTILASVLFLGIIGCSEEPTTPTSTPESDVNKYITALPSWDIFCPHKADEITKEDSTTEWECTTKAIETTTPCSITRTPEEIVTYDPGSEILYLGSLIQGAGYIGGLGSIKALPIYQRAPLSLSISFQMSNNSRLVANPNLTTVKQAIAELVEAAQNAGHVSGSSIFFDKRSSYSVQQTALALGLSAKFMKPSVQASLQWSSTSVSHTVSAYFVQKMFTVSMGIPQRPSDLFSSDFTQELLNEQIRLGRIGPNNLPVYVSNIVYGRMMTLTMTSDYEETEMKAALEGSYNGIGGSVSAEYLEILQNSEIQLVTIGGDANLALGYLRTGQLGEFFKENAPLTTAVPLSYTLRNLGDNEIAKVSETTAYDMVQYDNITVETYTNEGAWKNTVQSINSDGLQIWQCNRPNVLLADEHESFHISPTQCGLGKKITFHEDQYKSYPFTFYLESKDPRVPPPGDMGQLVYDDNEGWLEGWSRESISIGDINDYEDDDFEIGVSGNAKVYAIAFHMQGNNASSEEYLEVHAMDKNNQECQVLYYNTGINGFFGVISPVPVTRILFNEDSGGDDIALDDLYFGYK